MQTAPFVCVFVFHQGIGVWHSLYIWMCSGKAYGRSANKSNALTIFEFDQIKRKQLKVGSILDSISD